MNQKIDYFKQVKIFPEENTFSFYNLKVLSHFIKFLPLLGQKGKYEFYKKIIHDFLQRFSTIPENEIKNCLEQTLAKNDLQNPHSLKFFNYGLIYPYMSLFCS